MDSTTVDHHDNESGQNLPDDTRARFQGPHAWTVRPFFNHHLYLPEKCANIPKVPWTQCNVQYILHCRRISNKPLIDSIQSQEKEEVAQRHIL